MSSSQVLFLLMEKVNGKNEVDGYSDEYEAICL